MSEQPLERREKKRRGRVYEPPELMIPPGRGRGELQVLSCMLLLALPTAPAAARPLETPIAAPRMVPADMIPAETVPRTELDT